MKITPYLLLASALIASTTLFSADMPRKKTHRTSTTYTFKWFIPDYETEYMHGKHGEISFAKIEDVTWDNVIKAIRSKLKLSKKNTSIINITCDYSLPGTVAGKKARTNFDYSTTPPTQEEWQEALHTCDIFTVHIIPEQKLPMPLSTETIAQAAASNTDTPK